jgi:acetate kinase
VTDDRSLVLAVNAGSSSIKFGLFVARANPVEVHSGTVRPSGGTGDELGVAVQRIGEAVEPHLAGRSLAAIIHRVVHGGERFHGALRVTPEVVRGLRELLPLAPNHLPDEIALIETFGRVRPGIPQVACFDTAFHRDLPLVSRTLAVPPTPGLRRYGFHGLSYTYLLAELERRAGLSVARGRVVLAHLGNGASLAAVVDGRSVDTTMGMTPTGGLVMSSRSGDLDPGAATYLARSRGLSADQLDEILTRQSGLLAISGYTADMRDLLRDEGSNPRARLAVDVFCYQVKKWTGAFAAALDGLDTLVFSGGIGERSPAVRERICGGLGFLGLSLDPTRNQENAAVISATESRVRVHVIPTNEAYTMVCEALTVLNSTSIDGMTT